MPASRKPKQSKPKQTSASPIFDSPAIRQHLRRELERYIPQSKIEERIEDRITQCKAQQLDPLEWAYCECYEEVNFKMACYFKWEKVYDNRRS